MPSVPRTSLVGLPLERVPGFRRFAIDYAERFEQVDAFFDGNPAEPDAWQAAIARTRAFPRARSTVRDAVVRQLSRRGAPAEAIDAATALADPDTVAILTGQQAGLFGGPLFTLLKAITALKLAAHVASTHGVRCVPIFWIDAEDHDWDEVRACTVLDAELVPRTVALPAIVPADHRSAGTRTLDASVETAIAELEAALGETEFTASLLDRLRSSYRPGATLGGAFAQWLDSVLGARGLVVFDAADAALKPLVADVFAREIETAGRTSALADEAGRAMVKRGYDAQVTPQPDSVSLFRLDDGRHPLKVRGGDITWLDSVVAPGTLAAHARTAPDHYSPNVLLRPLVQDSLFPTAAYVAGPSELAYLGQLKQVYAHFGVPMPLFQPRATATLLDSGAERFLQRYDVDFESLQAQDEHALNVLLESQLPATVERSFETMTAAIHTHMADIVDAVGNVDATLQGAARSTQGRLEKDLATLHGKVVQAAKRRDETLRRQFTRTRDLTFPGGHLQERALGFVYFLNRYGPALIDRLEAELPLSMDRHWLLTV
jgi:bacillithiol biosynthesis cysteine-adding enzyme BshC